MNNPLAKKEVQIGGAIFILVCALVLGLTKWKLPALRSSLNQSNTNQAMTKSLEFPGRLPDTEITNQQARLVTNRGEVVIKLEAAQAPLTVSNFIWLAKQRFYDGMIWHRVVPKFVIQVGDPLTKSGADQSLWGRGGPGYAFPDEPVTGEYVTGTVAMANSGPNTNGSQFFIVLEDQSQLPPAYTIFGRVTSGLDVIPLIQVGDKIERLTIEPIL